MDSSVFGRSWQGVLRTEGEAIMIPRTVVNSAFSRQGVARFAGCVGVWLILATPSVLGEFIALDSTRGVGNQGWNGALGMDFDVIEPIRVTELGAFDSGQNGLSKDIEVGVFDRDTETLVAGLDATITSSNSLDGQSRYADIADVLLPIGSYAIVAQGYGSSEKNGNAGSGGTGPTIDEGGGRIEFVGQARYSRTKSLVYPTTSDGGPANRYDAGTFKYEIPEPGMLALLGTAFPVLCLQRRRR